jgi:hypothetical protein
MADARLSGWCPRCDALREGATTCPACHTPLTRLDPARPVAGDLRPDQPEPPPPTAPAPPPRIRAALVVAAVVVAGIAFVAGRAGGAGARSQAAPTTVAPTTTARPEPGQQRRPLGWTVTRSGVTLTAVSVERDQQDRDEDSVGRLTLRIAGLAPGQRVLALTGLRLRDASRGLYASPDQSFLGGTRGYETQTLDVAGTYEVPLGPIPPPSQLDTIEVGGLLLGSTDAGSIRLDAPGPWPDRPPLRPVRLAQDTVVVDPRPGGQIDSPLLLEVTAAFVGAGRATAVVGIKPTRAGDNVAGILPVTAELRANRRTICQRTEALSGAQAPPGPGILLSCPASPADRLTVAMGIGARVVRVDATLRAAG